MIEADDVSASPINDEDSGILLSDGVGVKASDLYDPATGKALLIPGTPLNSPPPAPDQMRMGLIDSGVLPDHPQLRNLIVAMQDFTGNDDPIDREGHGTIVAIELAANSDATTPKEGALESEAAPVRSRGIVSAKVVGPTGKIELDHVIKAIHWMATQNVRVVNMSLAFLGKKERYSGLCQAIRQYAEEPNGGIHFVAAAGNFGPNVLAYPASCEASNLISVGAVIEGKAWAQSGKGDIAAEGRVRLLPPYVFHYEEAERLVRAGASSRARAEYKASIADRPTATALFHLAILHIRNNDVADAHAALLQARELSPNNSEIEDHLGVVELLQGRIAEAKEHLDRAVLLNPNDQQAQKNLAVVMARLAEPAKQ